jgi:hypothetical protein
MGKRSLTRRITPLIMPGFVALLALLSSTTTPLAARAMWHAATRWTAELVPAGNGAAGPHGTVVLQPARQPNHVTVRVVISGDTPGAHRAWQVRAGPVDGDGSVLGPADAYATIRINRRGNGVAVIDLPIALPESGEFCACVYNSAHLPDTLIASGMLVRSGERA